MSNYNHLTDDAITGTILQAASMPQAQIIASWDMAYAKATGKKTTDEEGKDGWDSVFAKIGNRRTQNRRNPRPQNA
jgi:hypothetical protein